MVEIKRIYIEEYSEELIELSKIWCDENITNGLVANSKDDLKEPCYAAFDNNEMVGYIFGHYYTYERKSNAIPTGSKCFDIDELYVLKEYRSKGVGGKLFKAVEEEVNKEADFITLVTSTKDYKKILYFYTEMVDMTFLYADLYKKVK